MAVSGLSSNLVRPDVSKMIVYDPRTMAGKRTCESVCNLCICCFLEQNRVDGFEYVFTAQAPLTGMATAVGMETNNVQPILGLHPPPVKASVPAGIAIGIYYCTLARLYIYLLSIV